MEYIVIAQIEYPDEGNPRLCGLELCLLSAGCSMTPKASRTRPRNKRDTYQHAEKVHEFVATFERLTRLHLYGPHSRHAVT